MRWHRSSQQGEGPVALELEPGIEHAVAVHAAMLAERPLLTVRPGLPAAEREEVLAAGAPTTCCAERRGAMPMRHVSPTFGAGRRGRWPGS